jgi:D-serine deaminase-like pyridoxal phosphate-dependent protein
MPTRRSFLAYALGAPAVLHGRRYTAAEIQRLIERGHVRGKISKDDLPTPALLLDLDAFEANVRGMAEHLRRHGLAFRPHGKTHKCGEIARRLIRAGAVGCCAAKISEAEAFARDGIRGLLITTPVVGRHKIERAVALARRCPDTIFCVDHPQNARDLDAAAGGARVRLNVAVDLYVGRRTGVMPGEPALKLAELIMSLRNLRLAGIQAYAGHASHVVGFEKTPRGVTRGHGTGGGDATIVRIQGHPVPPAERRLHRNLQH